MRKLLLGLTLVLFAGPVSAQSILSGGGGGGAVSLIMGSSTSDCATDGAVLFQLSGKVNCDADITFATDTLTVTKIGAFNGIGQITMGAAANIITSTSNNAGIGIGGTSAAVANILHSTTQTPDNEIWATGSAGNSFQVMEVGDVGFDMNNCSAGTGAATDPLICVHSHNQNTTQWLDFSHDGTNGNVNIGTGILNVNGFVRSKSGELALNADYTNATGTMSNTALSATVTSGRTYSFSMELLFADSTAADGILVDFDGGAATMTNFRVQCNAANAVGAALAFTTAGSTAIATDIDVTLALTTQAGLTCHGTFVPSSSSTFIVRASQKAHTTGTLTIFRGSWINIRDANPL